MAEKIEIMVPKENQVTWEHQLLKVKGPKGELEKSIELKWLKVTFAEGKITMETDEDSKKNKAIMKSVSSEIENMLDGTQKNFVAKAAIVYSHFPITVTVKGPFAEVNNFYGEKKPRRVNIRGKTKVEAKGKEIVATGPSKDDVGQTIANFELKTKKRNRDTRIFQDGVYVTEKAALAGK